jgi:hypothetical protein
LSRSQQSQVFSTAQGESSTNEANAQKSEQTEQQDINNQQSQLAKFAANNPYMQGGEFQNAQNQNIAGAADATAEASRAGLQAVATRTGQNPAAGNAAAEEIAREAQRTASSQQGNATAERIGSEAKYNQQGLADAGDIAREQESLASLQQGASQGELGTQEQAAQTPSFLDQLGSGLLSGAEGVGAKWATHGA